ncbi:phage tail protein [Achromobacter pestifer]|uniref:Phage tail protein n=1 Tax=Achromobacter pestifer TaxID=1353889 RepID=A0A7D4E2K3_9BURK|nr:phage tail protein [Achromobacter pestifer]QKH37314.1 phage tail protein [Achromobacter pestifer]
MPKTKTVYQTDQNGLFLYELEANELALAEGFFNVPYGAYEDPPPIAPAGMVAIRMRDAWTLSADYRHVDLWLTSTGALYVTGTKTIVNGSAASYPGWGMLPDWLTLAKPMGAI